MKTFLLSFSGVMSAVFLVGCGQKLPDGMPPLYPLTLTVTQQDEPFPDASVSLVASDSTRKWTCGGMTEADGTLVVFTHGKYRGVPADKYKVTVDCVISEPPRPKNATMEELDAHARNSKSFRIVPLEYTDRATTHLEIEVVKGTNRLKIDVPEKVKISMGGAP